MSLPRPQSAALSFRLIPPPIFPYLHLLFVFRLPFIPFALLLFRIFLLFIVLFLFLVYLLLHVLFFLLLIIKQVIILLASNFSFLKISF